MKNRVMGRRCVEGFGRRARKIIAMRWLPFVIFVRQSLISQTLHLLSTEPNIKHERPSVAKKSLLSMSLSSANKLRHHGLIIPGLAPPPSAFAVKIENDQRVMRIIIWTDLQGVGIR